MRSWLDTGVRVGVTAVRINCCRLITTPLVRALNRNHNGPLSIPSVTHHASTNFRETPELPLVCPAECTPKTSQQIATNQFLKNAIQKDDGCGFLKRTEGPEAHR